MRLGFCKAGELRITAVQWDVAYLSSQGITSTAFAD